MGKYQSVMDELEDVGAVGANMLLGTISTPEPVSTPPTREVPSPVAKPAPVNDIAEAEALLKNARRNSIALAPTPVPSRAGVAGEAQLYGQIASVLDVMLKSMETLRDIFIQLQEMHSGGRNADIRAEK